MDSEPRTPYATAVILCDAVHRDPVTGKNTLLGTFSTITSRRFPATHAAMCAYVVLTDGVGRSDLALRIDAADETSPPIAEAQFDVDFDDPRQTFEIVVRFADVGVSKPGEYRVVLSCGDEVLLERRLMARSVGKGIGDG